MWLEGALAPMTHPATDPSSGNGAKPSPIRDGCARSASWRTEEKNYSLSYREVFLLGMKINKLKKRLSNKEKILLDAAMGTELQRKGVNTTLPLWSAEALISDPAIVKQIHIENILAGAEIITTNTFRTTNYTLKKKSKEKIAGELTGHAVLLAKEAIYESNIKKTIFIAGSVAPLEDCYRPDLTPPHEVLIKEHLKNVKNLKAAGVDFLLFETMITKVEILTLCEAAIKTNMPFAISFCCNQKGQLLSGEDLTYVIKKLEKYQPLFISINCISPTIVNPLISIMKKSTDLPVGVYANGDGNPDGRQGWCFHGLNQAEVYKYYAIEWFKSGVQIIGGCCGSNAFYISLLTNYLGKKT